jgi:hypothetical protein
MGGPARGKSPEGPEVGVLRSSFVLVPTSTPADALANAGVLGDPIFDSQTPDAPEFSDIGSDDRGAQGLGVRCNQKVVRADGLAGRLQLRANATIFGIRWHIERQDRHAC